MSRFLVSLSRAMNIPTYALTGPTSSGGPYLFGRTAAVFPTIGRALGIGRDVLYFRYLRENCSAPPAYIPAHRMLMAWSTFLDRFYDGPEYHDLALQLVNIELEVLPDDTLDLYCQDQALGIPPGPQSLVAQEFANHYTVAELQAMDLWTRLAAKATLLNYCD